MQMLLTALRKVVTGLCARASSMNVVGTLSPSMSWFLGDV